MTFTAERMLTGGSERIVRRGHYGKSTVAIDIKKDMKYYFSNERTAITHQKHIDYPSNKEKFQNFFSSFFIHSDSMHKFNKALTLHTYAVENNELENQLIFFWTALETIAIKNHNKTIINTVTTFILPFLKKRYFLENFQYIYEEMLHNKKTLLNDVFKKYEIELNLLNFAKSLILKDDKIREDLVEGLDDYPILRYKIFIINKELDTLKNVLKKIASHEITITEQIQRIYRYRNLVIHDAKDIEISTTLISNLHNYFDYILDEIIEHSYDRKILNIEELKLYLEMKLDKTKTLLNKETSITDENFRDIFLF
ncbi:MAG: hypothetical protein COB07_09640 [Sulfurovum sp.]|nr:MAG: hypothetical protein COB07_09640 [Sulfurovum sp.]